MREIGLTIRPFQESDLGDVLSLLALSLGQESPVRRTPELFEWKHLANPFGPSLMLVAIDEGRITGFRAFMRWELATADGQRLRCVRAVDTATHPDFRRRGIFRSLTMAGIELATDNGIDLVFNTPNRRSGAGYLTMGWIEVGPIKPLITPARGIFGGGMASGDVPVEAFVVDSDPVTAFDGAPRASQGLRTPRSTQFLKWRFVAHPQARYRQINTEGGSAIVRVGNRGCYRELLISEINGQRPARVIRQCRRRARTAYVAAFFTPGSRERRAALAAGMLPSPRRSLTLMARPLRPLPVDVAKLTQWDLALGDLELL